jgi:hypothetical protein
MMILAEDDTEKLGDIKKNNIGVRTAEGFGSAGAGEEGGERTSSRKKCLDVYTLLAYKGDHVYIYRIIDILKVTR